MGGGRRGIAASSPSASQAQVGNSSTTGSPRAVDPQCFVVVPLMVGARCVGVLAADGPLSSLTSPHGDGDAATVEGSSRRGSAPTVDKVSRQWVAAVVWLVCVRGW